MPANLVAGARKIQAQPTAEKSQTEPTTLTEVGSHLLTGESGELGYLFGGWLTSPVATAVQSPSGYVGPSGGRRPSWMTPAALAAHAGSLAGTAERAGTNLGDEVRATGQAAQQRAQQAARGAAGSLARAMAAIRHSLNPTAPQTPQGP